MWEESAGHALDAFAVTHLANVRYLSGFTGSNGVLLLGPDEPATLLTDPRYSIQAAGQCDCKVRTARGPLLKAAAGHLRRRQARRIGFEHNHISLEAYEALKGDGRGGPFLQPFSGLIERVRARKSPTECDLIRAAVALNSRAFENALRRLKPAMSELDLAAEIDYQMRRLGAEAPAFDTIVASGARSALPHARPTSKSLAPNQLLLIDMGAQLSGYASDMTRTLFLGRPGAKVRRLYRAVLEAQCAAIDAVREGVTAASVDLAARRVLRRAGCERAFVHSTGHGLGLEIHEPPRLGKGESTRLEAGMAITVEPGVYLEGFGGIRIEDTLLVTPQGAEVLTPTSKGLTAL